MHKQVYRWLECQFECHAVWATPPRGTCAAPFLPGVGTRRYMDFDSSISMSEVFHILHISFTAILPAITLFNKLLSCLHGSVCP